MLHIIIDFSSVEMQISALPNHKIVQQQTIHIFPHTYQKNNFSMSFHFLCLFVPFDNLDNLLKTNFNNNMFHYVFVLYEKKNGLFFSTKKNSHIRWYGIKSHIEFVF